MSYEEQVIIKIKKGNMIQIPDSIVKLYKLNEGDLFIVERPKWNNILLKKARLVEK